jgi:membrane protease YdiL (CAAX protease family)
MHFLENILGKDNAVWKYIITIVGAFLVAMTVGAIPFVVVLFVQIFETGGDLSPEMVQSLDFTSVGISENLSLFLMLIPFVVGLFVAILFVRYLHQRSFSETVNGTNKIRWKRIFIGFGVWFALMLLYLAVSYIIDPNNFVFQFNLQAFIPLFFIALFLIPLQTTFEEFLFRGYLAQGIGVWTKNRWLVVVIPAILFGLLHFSNTEVSTYGFWETMPQYILFGLIFGFFAVLDDGIELAIGIHAANNIFLSLFVTAEASSLKTPAIFYQQTMNVEIETISLLVMGLLAMFLFAKIYKWNFSVMNRKIERNTAELEQICQQE